MRLIDADILGLTDFEIITCGGSFKEALKILLNKIQNAPTVDAEFVRHGQWLHGREISRDYIGDVCVCIHYEKWWCSECDYHIDEQPLWEFCPICGAKMSEVEG